MDPVGSHDEHLSLADAQRAVQLAGGRYCGGIAGLVYGCAAQVLQMRICQSLKVSTL